MNVSKAEQRVLHALAQGGFIRHIRDGRRIVDADCFNREGHRMAGFTLALFDRLRKRGLIASAGGQPYRISPRGLGAVRGQLDNR